MAQLKIWGGLTFFTVKGDHSNRQKRAVVAATSKKKAAEIVGMSLYEFNKYWSETGNQHEISSARSWPEKMLIATCEIVYLPKEQYHPPRIPNR